MQNNQPETFDDLDDDWLNAEYDPSEDGLHCKEIIEIAAAQLQREADAQRPKPNEWVLKVQAALETFEDDDMSAAQAAQSKLECGLLPVKPYHSVPQIAQALDEIPPGSLWVAANPVGDALLTKLEKCVAVTVRAGYRGLPIRLRVPHPRVILVVKDLEQPQALSSIVAKKRR